MSASDKTEKATPKRREEARKKGQVARSTDLNGSVVLIAALGALAAFGPMIVDGLGESMRGLRWLEVMDQRAYIKGGDVNEFQVTVRVWFELDAQ